MRVKPTSTLLVLSFWSFVVAVCVACGGRPPSGKPPTWDAATMGRVLDAELDHRRQKDGVASYVITIVDEGGPIYEGAFGFSNEASSELSSLETPYRWGSNSKVFVMLALLQLEAEGLVSLDDPLIKHLPEFSIGPPPPTHPESATWRISDITLRSMLTHHSGLPNDYLRGFLSTDPIDFEEFVRGVGELRAQQPVGLSHSYSNLAYTLLGVVIERVSGESFNDYMRAHLFEPVGMKRASFAWTPDLRRRVARPYDGKGKERPIFEISSKPAGALIATTREMGLFASAILRGGAGAGGRFLSPEVLESSYVRQNERVPLDFDLSQGLAWRLDSRPVATFGRSIQHGGGILSHHTAFVILRDHGLGVLVATNGESGAAGVQEIAWNALALAIQTRTQGGFRPPPPLPAVIEKAERDLNEAHAWEGHYATILGDMRAVRRRDEVRVDAFGRSLFLRPVEPEGMGLWAKLFGVWDVQPAEMKLVRASLLRVADREVVVRELPWGRQLLGIKYDPMPAPPVWKRRVGRYRLIERAGDHHFLTGIELLLAPEGHLLMRPEVDLPVAAPPPSTALRPVDDEWAVTEGIGRNKSVWIRFDAQGRLEFSGLILVPSREKERCYGDLRCRGRFWKRRGIVPP